MWGQFEGTAKHRRRHTERECVPLLETELPQFTLADLLQGSNDPFSFPMV